MSISLKGKEIEVKKYRGLILRAGKEALSFMGKEKKNLCILLTDKRKMRSLNRKFRNVDSTPDVLSFPYGEKDSYLGDVAISLQKAEEQAKEYKENFEKEIARLVIHGILHLIGMRDDTLEERKEMWDKQEKILKFIKIDDQ